MSQASKGLERLPFVIHVWYDKGLPEEMDRSRQLWKTWQLGKRWESWSFPYVYLGGPGWWYCILLREREQEKAEVREGLTSDAEIDIAFGYHAALLHLQMNSAESGWKRRAGQDQSFISGARFRLAEETWIIGLYGSHWLQRRNSPFSDAGH